MSAWIVHLPGDVLPSPAKLRKHSINGAYFKALKVIYGHSREGQKLLTTDTLASRIGITAEQAEVYFERLRVLGLAFRTGIDGFLFVTVEGESAVEQLSP